MVAEQIGTRKEKRKAARQEKKQLKHQSLIQRQKLRKLKQNDNSRNLKDETVSLGEREIDSDIDEGPHQGSMMKMVTNTANGNLNNKGFSLTESDSEGEVPLTIPLGAVAKRKSRNDDRNSSVKKTKFEKYIELEMKGATMEEDLEMERRLAKKLKVKNGKLKDDDDGLNFLFDGVSSVFDLSEQEHNDNSGGEKVDVEKTASKKSKEKKKKKKSKKQVLESDSGTETFHSEQVKESGLFESGEEGEANLDSETVNVEGAKIKKSKRNRKKSSDDESCEIQEATIVSKYVPPHLRSRSDDLHEYAHIRRRIRGLLNRMSESNVESITGEIFSMFKSVPRAAALQIVIEEVLGSCSGGPRGNEQYASVFAAFVAGMASMAGMEFGARLLSSLAKCFEVKCLCISLCLFMILLALLDSSSPIDCPMFLSTGASCQYVLETLASISDLMYSFLIKLSKRLTEVDVSTILSILHCCGMKIRGDDPTAMKDFILSVQGRVNELKAGSEDVEATKYGKRMEFMLETICDIKNNKKKAKEDTPPHTRIKKWLQKLGVENITISGIDWNKLLDPEKNGLWWHSGGASSPNEDINKVAGKMDRDVHEAQKMLKLAAMQRMNTDTRRAIFCVIMSAEDYIDAFEQLLSLNLQGKQDREIMRVLLECCVQEKVFNKYYTALALKLCSHDKNHKFSLQGWRWEGVKLGVRVCGDVGVRRFGGGARGGRRREDSDKVPTVVLYCLWDQFKELESMPLLRSMHLAKFVADMLAGFSLSLAVLKVVDLMDVTQLTSKRIMHFRMLFEAIFEHSDNLVWNMFTRVAVTPELEDLRNGMEFFIREYVVAANKDFGKKFKLAKKALSNVEGVLM
ncbi:hypothetical protein KSS87_006900 [Heliosperma pusillum]|nr:hypothetical protein KSS87_006900 [Heliosperma pusillum]